MIVKMTRREKLALDVSQKFKDWDHRCVAKDTYLEGYTQALLDVEKYLEEGSGESYFLELSVGKEKIDVEFKDGEHQLTKDIKK